MSDRRRCRTCRSPMTATDTVLTSDLGPDIPAGSTITVFHCPHGKGQFNTHEPVPCRNCGEDVPGPEYHRYSVEGLLGSGRWTCTSVHQREQMSKLFSDLGIQFHEGTQ